MRSHKKNLEKLGKYAESEGFSVYLKYSGATSINWSWLVKHSKIKYSKFCFDGPKYIYIEDSHTYEIKVYLMLHELGHHELRKDWIEFSNKLPFVAMAEYEWNINSDKRYLRRLAYRIGSLHEEYLAWEEGYKLAGRLGIPVNYDKFHSFKHRCLKTYAAHYGK